MTSRNFYIDSTQEEVTEHFRAASRATIHAALKGYHASTPTYRKLLAAKNTVAEEHARTRGSGHRVDNIAKALAMLAETAELPLQPPACKPNTDFRLENGDWALTYMDADKQVRTPAATLWYGVRNRCNADGPVYRHRAYNDCTMAADFRDYQTFAEWCNTQRGYGLVGFEIDKDILVPDNTIYTASTCAFVPHTLNMLYRGFNRRGIREVSVQGGTRWRAIATLQGTQKYLGTYDTEADAVAAVGEVRSAYLTILATQYRPYIEERIYAKLLADAA